MPHIRRFIATLLALLVLQATLLGAAGACPAGGEQAAAERIAGGHDAHGGHGGHGDGDHEGHGAPDGALWEHESPDRAPLHCQAAMTCAITGLVARVAQLPAGGLVAIATIAVHDDATPVSFGGAPEPPPPRA